MGDRYDKKMAELDRRCREKQENPPERCERCHKLFDEYDRWWEGSSGQWLCTDCDEKVVPK